MRDGDYVDCAFTYAVKDGSRAAQARFVHNKQPCSHSCVVVFVFIKEFYLNPPLSSVVVFPLSLSKPSIIPSSSRTLISIIPLLCEPITFHSLPSNKPKQHKINVRVSLRHLKSIKMQIKSFTTGAAVLLASIPTALAGTAHVVNNCGIPVYFASVAAGANPSMTLLPSGGFSQAYGAIGVGTSIKLAPSLTGAVTQLEFTSMEGGKVAYDMSNIDGNPFAAGGMTLSPSMGSDSSNPTCVPVHCAAGEAVCTAAYNQPDDTRTLVCNSGADLTLVLCSGASMKRDESSAMPHRMHPRHLPKLA